MNRPVSGPDSVKAYLNRELDNIQDYNHKRLDFYRYYRSGASARTTSIFCEISLIILSSISIAFILNGILCFRHVEISESPRFSPVTCWVSICSMRWMSWRWVILIPGQKFVWSGQTAKPIYVSWYLPCMRKVLSAIFHWQDYPPIFRRFSILRLAVTCRGHSAIWVCATILHLFWTLLRTRCLKKCSVQSGRNDFRSRFSLIPTFSF